MIATTLHANTTCTSTIADITKERIAADCDLNVTGLEEPSALPEHQQLHVPDTVSQSSLPHVSELKTKLCRAIEKCTGLTDELKNLDELRHKLKTEKHQQQHLCADKFSSMNN